MLSRVADSLYWMSRYLERADHVARQMDVHLAIVPEQDNDAAQRRRSRLISCLVNHERPLAPVETDYDLMHLLIFDEDNHNSVVQCIAAARENARQVREQINSQMWEQINQLYLSLQNADLNQTWEGQPHSFLHNINQEVYRFQGITDARISRDQGWHFIQLGRYIERAAETSDALNVDLKELFTGSLSQDAMDQRTYLDWVGLLRGCAAYEAYNRLYTANLRPHPIVEFLLLNAEFPYSVHFAINMVQGSLDAIGAATDLHKSSRIYRMAGRLRAMLDYGQVEEILESGFGDYLVEIQNRCAQIHEAIYETFISYPIDQKLAG